MSEKEHPILSVIVPVYNTGKYLREALDSVIMQDFQNLEVIVINDGSTDNSAEILEEYEKRLDCIHVFHRKNSGLSSTRNFGLKQARGRYIYFFDSDDRVVDGALKNLVSLIKKTNSDIIGFSGRDIDQQGNYLSDRRAFQKLNMREPLEGQVMLAQMINSGSYSPIVSMYIYKHAFLEINDFKFADGFIHEDEYFTIRALSLAKKAVSISEILFEHRIREGSIMSRANKLENAKGWALAVSQMLSFLSDEKLQPRTKRIILQRAKQLAHNTIKIIQKEKSSKVQISDFFSHSDLHQLGFHVRLRSSSPALFKVYNKIRNLVSINKA